MTYLGSIANKNLCSLLISIQAIQHPSCQVGIRTSHHILVLGINAASHHALNAFGHNCIILLKRSKRGYSYPAVLTITCIAHTCASDHKIRNLQFCGIVGPTEILREELTSGTTGKERCIAGTVSKLRSSTQCTRATLRIARNANLRYINQTIEWMLVIVGCSKQKI